MRLPWARDHDPVLGQMVYDKVDEFNLIRRAARLSLLAVEL